MTFKYPDGSIGTVSYLANGNKNYGKERLEVFSSGKIGVLDDFRSLELVTEAGRHSTRSRLSQDKGHAASWAAFLGAVTRSGTPPIPYEQLLNTTQASFGVLQAMQSGREITL